MTEERYARVTLSAPTPGQRIIVHDAHGLPYRVFGPDGDELARRGVGQDAELVTRRVWSWRHFRKVLRWVQMPEPETRLAKLLRLRWLPAQDELFYRLPIEETGRRQVVVARDRPLTVETPARKVLARLEPGASAEFAVVLRWSWRRLRRVLAWRLKG